MQVTIWESFPVAFSYVCVEQLWGEGRERLLFRVPSPGEPKIRIAYPVLQLEAKQETHYLVCRSR